MARPHCDLSSSGGTEAHSLGGSAPQTSRSQSASAGGNATPGRNAPRKGPFFQNIWPPEAILHPEAKLLNKRTGYIYTCIYIYIYISSGLRPNPATALSLRILCASESSKRRSVGDPVVLFLGRLLSILLGLFFQSSISACV